MIPADRLPFAGICYLQGSFFTIYPESLIMKGRRNSSCYYISGTDEKQVLYLSQQSDEVRRIRFSRRISSGCMHNGEFL